MKQHDNNEAMRLVDRISPETDWYEFDQVTWCNEAAALLRKQAERIAELESRVHTCGPTCSKAGCINRRVTAERDTLREEVEAMGTAISDFCDGTRWAVDVWKNQSYIKPLFDIDTARKATQ